MKKRVLAPAIEKNLPFTNKDIWQTIDRLAADKGISVSRLAIKSGLDPTAFNKCRRRGQDGTFRCLSMETISKLCTATGETLLQFTQRLEKIAKRNKHG